MHRWQQITILIIMALTLSACPFKPNFTGMYAESPFKAEDDDHNLFFVPQRARIHGLPTGKDPYSEGFRDGCTTNLSVVGMGTLRMAPERIKPERMEKDPLYVRGYFDGGKFCYLRYDWEGH